MLLLILSGAAHAQGTAFSYQGRLTDSGNPADGLFDMQFKLFDTATVGAGSQQGATVTNSTVQVTNGVFTIELDFGAAIFTGAARFLEIGIRPAGSPAPYTLLSPRQPLTSAPYAIRSNAAATADALSVACVGCVTSGQIQSVAGGAVTGAIPVASIPAGSANYIQNSTAQQAAANFNISGDGAVGGALSGGVVNAGTQYNIAGQRVLSVSGPFSIGPTVFASSNTFLGDRAGINTTPGDTLDSNDGKFNTFVGAGAGAANVSGRDNSFFGERAGAANIFGSRNTFFGRLAGQSNTTASDNSLFGASAGSSNTGNLNSFFGSDAGASNTTGNSNSFFGAGAGSASTTGFGNSFFGKEAGVANLTGSANAFFGRLAGDNNITGSNNTIIGFSADVGANNLNNAAAIGSGALVAQSNAMVLGSINGVNGATATVSVGIGTTTPSDRLHVVGDIRIGTGTTGCVKDADGTILTGSCSSDARLKHAITPFPALLDRLVQLRPVHFFWRAKEFPERVFGDRQSYGLIAQEVERVMPELVTDDEHGYKVVNYSKLPLMSVQAIKELKIENDNLKESLRRQQEEIAALKRVVCQMRPDAEMCR